jgi:hypothetical protein
MFVFLSYFWKPSILSIVVSRVFGIAAAFLLLVGSGCFTWRCRKCRRRVARTTGGGHGYPQDWVAEPPQLDGQTRVELHSPC